MAHGCDCKIIRKAVTIHTPEELGPDVANSVMRHIRDCPRCNWWYGTRMKRIEAAIISAGVHDCEDARTVMEWARPEEVRPELREMVHAHLEKCPDCVEWVMKTHLDKSRHKYN